MATGRLLVATRKKSSTSVLVPVDGGWLDSRIPAIARRLRARDRRLFVQARCNAKRRVLHYEVWWRDPKGREHFVGRWRPDEVDRIEVDVVALDQTAPGHEPSWERADRHNEEIEDRATRQIRDLHGAMLERVAESAARREENRPFYRYVRGALGKP